MKRKLCILAVALIIAALSAPVAETQELELMALMGDVNTALEGAGMDFRVDRAEYLTESDEMGLTVFFNNRTKQLGHHFVPNDPNRFGIRNILWQFDQSDGATASGLTAAQTEAAVDRAMATWQNETCSTIPLTKVPDFGLDLGVVEFIFTGGATGLPFPVTDLAHAGWGSFAFPPNVIGVTFTFIFVDGGGNSVDQDNNGKLDTAFREIYYNDAFNWQINANIDVETVALHEAGHGISQGHFGLLFRTDANGQFHFAPRAVMNAGYTGVQQNLAGTDSAGHCSIWGSWPLN